jgi:hypothetical protein
MPIAVEFHNLSNGNVVRAIKQSSKQLGDKGQVGNLRKSKAAMAMDRLDRKATCFEGEVEMRAGGPIAC